MAGELRQVNMWERTRPPRLASRTVLTLVDNGLRGRSGMDSDERAVADPTGDLVGGAKERCDAVGRARCHADDGLARIVTVVHTVNEHGGRIHILRRR